MRLPPSTLSKTAAIVDRATAIAVKVVEEMGYRAQVKDRGDYLSRVSISSDGTTQLALISMRVCLRFLANRASALRFISVEAWTSVAGELSCHEDVSLDGRDELGDREEKKLSNVIRSVISAVTLLRAEKLSGLASELENSADD